MAEITSKTQLGYKNRAGFLWEGAGTGDTTAVVEISGGKYSFTVEGNFSGAAGVVLQYSKTGVNFYDLDATNLNFTTNGTYNFEIARGFVKAVISGGDVSTDLDIYVDPIQLEK